MPQKNKLGEILETIEESCEDPTIPKNVKLRFQEIVSSLKEPTELSIKINKILHDLDEISEDTNLQPYIRTQIWNIVSMLEKI